jgi:hypothetical protein
MGRLLAALLAVGAGWGTTPPVAKAEAITRLPLVMISADTVRVVSLQGGARCHLPGNQPDPAQVAWASQVKTRHEDALLQLPQVVGTGIGWAQDTGEVVIQLYVAVLTEQVRQAVPAHIEGIRVQVVETGEFRPR